MRLKLALNTVVRQRFFALLDAKKLLKLGIRKNFPTILWILKVVPLNVGTNGFSHIDTRLQFARIAPDELGHFLRNRNLLQKT